MSVWAPLRRHCLNPSSARVYHGSQSLCLKRHFGSSKRANNGSIPEPTTTRLLRPLFPPSTEQQVAIDTLLQTQDNIVIDACAGSGKTTTILHLAQSAPDIKFLVLVYNRRLMIETEERVQALSLQNVTVLNFHTLGVRYYIPECATDQGLKRVVQDDMPVQRGQRLPEFSILVLDEQQDMTPILKRFVDKVIRDKGFPNGRSVEPTQANTLRLVVLGDKRQEIYGFNNADSRFLSLASRPEVFGYVNENGWITADQTTSNRVTQPNVDFINQQLLKLAPGGAMRAVKNKDKDGLPFARPRYVVCDPYEDVLNEVERLLDELKVLPSEIIVLAPSVRAGSAAIALANDLALNDIPVFRSTTDVADISPTVAQGKVLICSYHQAKGIERKAAIVLGFDQGYHTYFDKTAEAPKVVSNPQYVATTRALEHLVLIHDYKSDPLPFVDLSTVSQTCDYHEAHMLEPKKGSKKSFTIFKVSGLCRNLSETLITECLRRLSFISISEPFFGIEPPVTEIEDRHGLPEDVSSITGTAVPAIYQWRRKKGLSVYRGPTKLLEPPLRQSRRRNFLRELPKKYYDQLRGIKERYEDRSLSTEDILLLSNFAMAAIDNDITKLLALPLDKYKWFEEPHCQDLMATLGSLPDNAHIPWKGTSFERQSYRKFTNTTSEQAPTDSDEAPEFIVRGAMDIVNTPAKDQTGKSTVWEIKYTQTLAPEHLLQTALYMLLLGNDANGFLVSARTGQTVQVLPRTETSLREILQLLVDSKSGADTTRLLKSYSDEEFLAECGRDFDGLVGECALPAWFSMRPKRSKFQKDEKLKARE